MIILDENICRVLADDKGVVRMNIAIDGPAGAGKSTIAKKVASRLKYIYVDTGAMYRAMALYFIRQGVSSDNESEISRLCKDVNIGIEYKDGMQAVILNGEDVSGLIRTEEVGNMASAISVYSDVRSKLVALQQQMAANTDVVMDGRDICTVVLPKAEVKIFLTASSRVRASRRYNELLEKGIAGDLNKIEADIIERDNRDMNRENSPLRQAKDAVLLDSSDMSIDEVVQRIMELTKQVG